jgi:hypothetical protein
MSIISDMKPTINFSSPHKALACLCAFLGLLIGIALIGFDVIIATNIGWLKGGDPLVHYLSWEFFRQSPWTNPIGQNPGYGIEIASSLIYTDLIPLLAIFFKPFSHWLPYPFQYLGIWTVLCFGLQGFFGFLLAQKITSDRFAQVLIGIFFIFIPVFLFRMGYHTALVSHFLLLWAINLSISPNKFWQWLILIALSALMNSYLFTMVLGLWFAGFLQEVLRGQYIHWRSRFIMCCQAFVISLVVFFIFWQSGYFTLPPQSYGISGFGIQRINLFSAINPQNWSYVIPPIPEAFGDLIGGQTGLDFYARRTESFQYVGIGVIILSLFALPAAWHIRSSIYTQLKKRQFLVLILFAFTLFSLSNHIGIGNFQIVIPLPEFIYNIASTWRASARFFWPVIYCWMTFILWSIFRYYTPNKAITILIVCFGMQIIDTSKGWLGIYPTMSGQASSAIFSPLKSVFWSSAPTQYSKLKIIPLRQMTTQNGWDVFGLYALQNHLQTNISYFARLDANKINVYNALMNSRAESGTYERDTFYIVDEEVLPKIYHHLKKEDLLAKIDGRFILAPGWFECTNCPTIIEMHVQLLDDRFKQPTLGEKIAFGKGGSGIRYLNGDLGPNQNWAYPEDWGTWVLGHTGKLTLPLPKQAAKLLELELYFPNSTAHPQTQFQIQLSGGDPAQNFSSNSGKISLQIPIPKTAYQDGYIVMNLSVDQPVIPKEIGIGDDTRSLALGLGSITFK